MKTRLFLTGLRFVALGICLSLPALADEKKDPIDLWLDKAIEKDGSTAGMRQATMKAETMWDKQLNKEYQALLPGLTPKQRAAMVKAQKAWIAFRDADRKAYWDIVGSQQGTMWPLAADGYSMELVKKRVQQLRVYHEDTSAR